MPHLERNSAARRAPITIALAAAFLLACGTQAPVGTAGGEDYEAAVALFVEGDYSRAAKALERYVDETDDPAKKIGAYYYLGRAYLELGDRTRAAGAFETAVRLGDDGPSREYLDRMAGDRTGDPRLVEQQVSVTRFQLAALIVKLVEGDGFDLDRRDPIDRLVERGWMMRLPDGRRHEDAVVTQAAFYAIVARMLADGGLPGGAIVFTGTPWSIDPVSRNEVSGRVVVEVLERVARFEPN